MAGTQRYMEYKPRTTYKDTLSPEEKKPVKLCTVWPEDLAQPHNGRYYLIPGPKDGARFGFVLVGASNETDDLGECRTLTLHSISARRTAKDVIGLAEPGIDEITGNIVCAGIETSELFERGYFVPEGDEPSEKELEAAETRRQTYMERALSKGDRQWGATHDIARIPAEAFTAAKFLGVERPWQAKITPGSRQIACPVCTNPITFGMHKCLTCNEWIDYDDAGTAFAVNDPRRKKAVLEQKLKERAGGHRPLEESV